MANKVFNGVNINMKLTPMATHANLSTSNEDLAIQMGKIQEWYHHIPLIGTCTTAGNNSTKVVTCQGFQLITGTRIIVFFTNSSIISGYRTTMNVNDTGDIYIIDQYLGIPCERYLRKDHPCTFMYDGTNWILLDDGLSELVIAQSVSSSKSIIAGSLACYNGTDYESIVIYSGSSVVIDTSAVFTYPPIIVAYTGSSDIELSSGTASALTDTYYSYPFIDDRQNGYTGSRSGSMVFLEITFNASYSGWSPSRIVYNGDTGAFVDGKGYIFLGYASGLYHFTLTEFHPMYVYTNSTLMPADVYIGTEKTTLFGTCSTAAGTTQKSVTLASFDHLYDGATITVRFTNRNTASNPTLKIGSTSAKAIKLSSSITAGTNAWAAGETVQFTYNSTDDAWIMTSGSAGTQSYTTDTSKLHPVLFSPNSVAAGFTHDVADPTAAVYNTTSNKNAFFTNKFLVSDGGTLLVNGLAMASVFDTAIMTGVSMQDSRYIHTALTPNESTVNSTLIRGYAGKIGNAGTGQLCQVGASGLTVIAGGDIGDTLAGEIADDQSSADAAKLTLYSDSSGDPITAVGSDITGRSNSLVLAASSAIFFVGPAGTVDDKPIRRGFYMHPGTSDYSSRPRLVPSENGTALLGTQSTRWRSGYINTVYGELNGSISSGTTAVTQDLLDNSTKVATTAYVDSLTNRYGRSSYNQSWPNPAPTNVWAKVAHCTVEVTTGTQNLITKTTFLVSQRLNNSSKRLGILTIESNSSASNDTVLEASWLVADPGIDPENYVVVSTDTNISATTRTSNIELWVKWTYGYEYILFKPLLEHVIGATRIIWTFDNPVATAGQAAYTVGTTTAISSLVTLKNDISGNAATATTANSATSATSATSAENIDVTASNPSSNTTYYTTFQETGTGKPVYYNDGYTYTTKEGTTSAAGLARLTLGNNKSSTTAGNKSGELVLYGSAATYSVTLKPATISSSSKTVTIPNKTGTMAMTSDIPNVNRSGVLYYTTAGTKWGRVLSLTSTGQTTYVILLSVSQGMGNEPTNHYKGAGILQISCNTSSAGTISSNNSAIMWLVAGGNISSSNFALIGYNNAKYDTDGKTVISQTGSAVFELWIKNTANYHVWCVRPMQELYASTFGEYFTFYNPRNADAVSDLPATSLVSLTKTSAFFTPVTS